MVALFWLLLRVSINPLNCYGVLPLYSSELDGFFFTVYAIVSARVTMAHRDSHT